MKPRTSYGKSGLRSLKTYQKIQPKKRSKILTQEQMRKNLTQERREDDEMLLIEENDDISGEQYLKDMKKKWFKRTTPAEQPEAANGEKAVKLLRKENIRGTHEEQPQTWRQQDKKQS